MARGVLCPKCAMIAAATATVCPRCATVFASGIDASERSPNHGSALTVDEDGPRGATRPFKAFTPDATFTDHDHAGATVDLDGADSQTMELRALQGPTPEQAQEPQPKGTSAPRRTQADPVAQVNAPAARRPGALAQHQAAAAAVPPSPRKDPMTGEKLGEYIVEEKIGTGGMGVVYKARQPQIGSTVAIKILRGDVIVDKRDLQRLLDEARVVNAIKHRGIINIFGAGELPDGRQYLVMEYLDGETLEKRLERVERLSTADALPILDEVLAALAAAHGTGIVHRDLKPANIFLVKQSDGPDLVKLLDFGLARRQMQEVSRIAGTPDYISPEHARGRPAGPPADLYGFGVLAFHLLTGELPFKGNTPMEMMEQHVHSAPPVPTEINPSIPPAMSGLILALMEKDPARRPDADRARQDLKAAGRQLQTKAGLETSNPMGGRPAFSAPHRAGLDSRLKELTRKGDLALLLRTATRNWPWVLAGFALLWVVGVVVWMRLTPNVPIPPATPFPGSVKKAAAPVRVAPQIEVKREVPVEPGAPKPSPPEPSPIEAPPLEAPAAAVAAPEKHDLARAPPLKEEVALNKWRLKMKNELAVLDAQLSGNLEQFRPALNDLAFDIEGVNNPQGQQSTQDRLEALKVKFEHETESR